MGNVLIIDSNDKNDIENISFSWQNSLSLITITRTTRSDSHQSGDIIAGN